MSRQRKRPPPPARPAKQTQTQTQTQTRDRVPRQPWLDALRGAAVLMMIAYHFGYDLNFLGWLHQDINHDLRWMTVRSLILGSFLFSVGASHALGAARWRRIGRITGAAMLVTAGSGLLFPQSTIWFGVLHAIVVMSLLLPVLDRWRLPMPILLLAGIGAIAAGNLLAYPAFDSPALSWIGLRTHLPQTEDYVPLLPWFGVCLLGYVAMQSFLRRGLAAREIGHKLPHWLRWTGRHSLAIYLLHQPVLLGILIPLSHLFRPA